jgi:hypothetical protein
VAGDFQWQLSVTDEHGAESDPLPIVVTAEQEEMVTVPDASTCDDLEFVGLLCDEQFECSDTVPEDQKISQSLDAETQVAPGSTVTLVISTGPCHDTFPCDLDNNGYVDLFDRNVFLSSYRLCTGDEGFLPEADYDNDGCISLNDYREWFICYQLSL